MMSTQQFNRQQRNPQPCFDPKHFDQYNNQGPDQKQTEAYNKFLMEQFLKFQHQGEKEMAKTMPRRNTKLDLKVPKVDEKKEQTKSAAGKTIVLEKSLIDKIRKQNNNRKAS